MSSGMTENNAKEYKVGQVLTSDRDMEAEKGVSGERAVIPKGSRIIIGADRLAHHIGSGIIQPLAEGAEVRGYDAGGMAEYLYMALRSRFPVDEMLEWQEDTGEDFIGEVRHVLIGIGFRPMRGSGE